MTRYAIMVMWVSMWRVLVIKDGQQAIYDTREKAEQVMKSFINSDELKEKPKYHDICVVELTYKADPKAVGRDKPALTGKR